LTLSHSAGGRGISTAREKKWLLACVWPKKSVEHRGRELNARRGEGKKWVLPKSAETKKKKGGGSPPTALCAPGGKGLDLRGEKRESAQLGLHHIARPLGKKRAEDLSRTEGRKRKEHRARLLLAQRPARGGKVSPQNLMPSGPQKRRKGRGGEVHLPNSR